jgi:hypothetical protein
VGRNLQDERGHRLGDPHTLTWAIVYDIREVDGADGRAGPQDIGAERPWSLARDAGPAWRSAVAFADHWRLWEDPLRRHDMAEFVLAAHPTRLPATGAAEGSPNTLPTRAPSSSLSRLGTDCEGLSLASAQALAVRGCRHTVGGETTWTSPQVPWTIRHDDLNSNNIDRVGSARAV